jgi:hypothetical protein
MAAFILIPPNSVMLIVSHSTQLNHGSWWSVVKFNKHTASYLMKTNVDQLPKCCIVQY